MPFTRRLFTGALVALTVLCSSAAAQAPNPTQLFVFGDSLSDTGNDLLFTQRTSVAIPPPQTYASGRFSNGPVAFEYLWAKLRPGTPPLIAPSLALQAIPPAGAVSFAFGGAGSDVVTMSLGFAVPGLKSQVEMFHALLHGQLAPSDALYAIWIGSNDYDVGGEALLTPDVVVRNIAESIGALYGLGARHVLVVNLPDLGSSPLIPPDSPVGQQLTALTTEHNKLLAKTMKELEKRLPGLTIIEGDSAKFVKLAGHELNTTTALIDALVPPLPGGIPASACLTVNVLACPAVPGFNADAPYLYWDSDHPTTAASALFADDLALQVTKALRHQR